MTNENKPTPFDKPNYYQAPNIFVDDFLKNLSGAETKVMVVITRRTRGWRSIGKVWDEASLADISRITGLGKTQIRESIKSLLDKKLIVRKFSCERCKQEFNELAKDFVCPICKSKESPNRLYKLNDGDDEGIEGNFPESGKIPESETANKEVYRKVIQGVSKSDTPPVSKSDTPPLRRMANDAESQERKEILFKETLNPSLSEGLTKEDHESDFENFDILEERERDDFSEKLEQEPEEEKRQERDFRSIKESEPNQNEAQKTEGVDKFTAGLLAGIGNPSAFQEEKPKEREDKSGEKEINDILNSCLATGWNVQMTDNDKEIVKEIRKFPYKDVEAACDDRMTKNRPNTSRVFVKWVLDGLRSGIKAKKLTQLEKEAYLEDELEKYYQNGNGDKVLCRDVIKKLYSVISIVGMMENRYRAVMDWCGWEW
jgi:hypothetical protein